MFIVYLTTSEQLKRRKQFNNHN